uniref:Rac GTPase-activating protein 1 n=1 Tax=Panagrolaimus davidi TaxID=227884 RepID=A0A914PT86_9BILA
MPPPPPPSKLCSTESASICREFADNWSHYKSLLETDSEQDILNVLNTLEAVRVKWQKSDAEARYYKEKLSKSEKNSNELKSAHERLNGKLLHCQATLDRVSKSKDAIADELKGYKIQWEKLRSILKDSDKAFVSDGLLAIINNVEKPSSSLNVTTRTRYRNEETQSTYDDGQSDIDYDNSGEVLLDVSQEDVTSAAAPSHRRSNRKRPSTSAQTPKLSHSTFSFDDVEATPSKRSRNIEDTEVPAIVRTKKSSKRKPPPCILQSMKRSLSESNLIDAKDETIPIKPKAHTPHLNASKNTFDFSSPMVSSWTYGQEIDRRTHRVKVFNTVFETCDVCTKRFGITATNSLKCVDCNIRFHRHCQSRAPMPCVPKVPMPKTPSKQKCPLAQYCPETHPFIPPLIIHCIVALERDRLNSEGIYRLTSNAEIVGKLYQEFLTQRKIPILSSVETENITGCIKKFLKELRDSLIPSTSFEQFIHAIESNDEQQIITCVFELPAPNRDTLAYFILHLQKVSQHSQTNKMPIENLATVLAPTIIEYPALVTLENVEKLNRNQVMILLRLLKLPTGFWKTFLDSNMDTEFSTTRSILSETQTIGSTPILSSLTPTKPSKRGRRSVISNILDLQSDYSTSKTSVNSSPVTPIIQPLSNALKGMRRISFKAAI